MQNIENFYHFFKKNLVGLTLIVILSIHSYFVISTIYSLSPTFDEGGHVYAGLLYVSSPDSLDYYYHNPPLAKYLFGLAAKLLNSTAIIPQPPQGVNDWYDGFQIFMSQNGSNYINIINSARFVSLFFSLAGCLILFFWTKTIIRKQAALIVVALWSFSPMMISLAALATPDMAATVLFLAALITIWQYLKRPSFLTALQLGLLMGFAVATKFSNILLYPIAIILAITASFIIKTKPPKKFSHLLVVVLVSISTICAIYQFQGVPTRLSDFYFHSRILSGETPDIDFLNGASYSNGGNNFLSGPLSIIGQIPLPIPQNMLLGFDTQLSHENGGLPSYLNGSWKKGGWIYYYLIAILIKTPLFVLIMTFLALTLWAWKPSFRLSIIKELFLTWPAIFFFIVLSFSTGINSHSRYILPTLPLFLIWTARGLDFILTKIALYSFPKKIICSAILAVLIILPAIQSHPHHLSYFNELIGGPKNGWRYLVDSNLDWGQDLLILKKWLNGHPEATPINLAYFGSTFPDIVLSPNQFSVATPLIINSYQHASWDTKFPSNIITPGWYAISANLLAGMPIAIYGQGGQRYLSGWCSYCYFQRFEPVARAGYSIYIYHLTEKDIKNIDDICNDRPSWISQAQCLYKKGNSKNYFEEASIEGINLLRTQ